MSLRISGILFAMGILFLFAGSAPSLALTMRECGAKYLAAKEAGTLKGMKWKDFRNAECGATPVPTKRPQNLVTGAIQSGRAVFPSAVARKYASEPLSKARMLTCLDQYRANMANGGNGNLKWIERSGGYYNQCSSRLAGR